MDVGGDLIWGDDSESEVFAQARSHDFSVILRYSWNPKFPQSLPSRIVTCYHDLPADDACETFPNRASMREALYSSIRGVWDQCVGHPSVTAADVTVEIYEDAERQDHCCQYAASSGVENQKFKPTAPWIIRAFKRVDFGAFLESQADFEHQKDVYYHEIRTISSLPPHPNIIPPSNTFVTVRKIDDDRQTFACGALYPFMEHGTLDDQIQNTKATGARLPLINKAAWCFQMASAIAHAHFTAHTFHMDIKSANSVLNARKDLILVDWEQSGAALYTLAPEADGSWDVKEATTGSSYHGTADSAEPKLVYEKYAGPDRENLAWGRPKWNVFPSWGDLYPRALDAAEVFSLGRTMWMLSEQVAQSEVEERNEVVVPWSDVAKDIPEDWKGVVSRYLNPDQLPAFQTYHVTALREPSCHGRKAHLACQG